MNVLFLFNGTYPLGMAMSNRLHLYCKCLHADGMNLEVIVPSSEKIIRDGYYEEIKHSSIKNPIIFKNYILRQLNCFFASFIYAYYCLKYSKKFKIIFIIGFGWFATTIMIAGAYFGRAKTVLEVNENPYSPEGGRLDSKWIRKIRRQLMLILPFQFADGFIVISEALEKLVNKHRKRSAQIIKIPIITDWINGSLTDLKMPDVPFILHSGALSETKDGVIAIFKAYAKACMQLTTSLQFVFTSKVMQKSLLQQINKIIKENGFEERIIFTGLLSKKELDELRNSCSMAIINKPSNWQNDYNFPTKLGEYLASGVPTIVSSTGEMNKFLKDNETAFIVPANDIDALASKILFIINNPDIAFKVGQAGKNLAKKEFYFMNFTGKISDFLISIAN